jgi:multicomponent Na+:H+ antiporter subunit A
MVLGAVVAILQTDLKKILAYTTVSALGMLFLMIGIDTAPAIQAAVVFVLAHALYKGTLFLITGNVDHGTGTRNILVLSGLRKYMPVTAGSAVLACLAMSGFLPFFGFIAKEMLYEAALEAPAFAGVLIGVVGLSGVLFVTVAFIIGYKVFFGPHMDTLEEPHEAGKEMLVAPVVLSVLGLFFGIFPETFPQRLLNVTAAAVLNEPANLQLHIWHGFNTVLFLSLLTLLAGFLLYRSLPRLPQLRQSLRFLDAISPEKAYHAGMAGLDRLAVAQTNFFQNGYLRNYISVILLTFIGLMGYTVYNYQLPLQFFARIFTVTDIYLHEALVCLLFPLALPVLFVSRSRLTALTILGVVGYAVALIFMFFGAPDVTITQFLVETLTVVLFVLVLHRLPLFWSVASNRTRIKYTLLAITFGAIMTYVLLSVTDLTPATELQEYFAANSLERGHGRNIVNVILVDFRALDTMGEITVLAIASIGIYALMKLQLDRDKSP